MSGHDDFDWSKIADPPKRRRKRGRPEAKVQAQIVQFLLNAGAVLAVTDAGVLSKMGLGMSCGIPKGWGDITACLPGGQFLMVEVKAPGGRQSPEQKRCQERIYDIDGWYILAESLIEFAEKYHNLA
jgi:hypothetical protein